MMTLEKLERKPSGVELTYTVTHSTPGREGTTLDASVLLCVRLRSYASITVEGADGETPAEALGKLSAWLRRLADGIDNRKEVALPL